MALGIKRLREGFEIKELGIEQEVSKRVEYQVAQRIVQRIEVIAGVSFPEEEIAYLTLHLMAKSNHKENQNDQELSKELAKVLKDCLRNFIFISRGSPAFQWTTRSFVTDDDSIEPRYSH